MVRAAKYELRDARIDEYEPLFALHKEAMGGYVRETWGVWDDGVQREFFDERMARGLLQVVEVGGALAGLLEVELRGEALFIINIELAREFRRRSIGSAIIRTVQSCAANHGLPLELTVLRVNPARALYERLGFVEFDRSSTHHYMRWMPAGLHAGGRS